MSDSAEDQGEKTHEPSQKKLDDARKKGEIARSADLNVAASYGGLVMVAFAVGSNSLLGLGNVLAGLLANSDRLSSQIFAGSSQAFSGSLLMGIVREMGIWFVVPGLFVLLSIILQKSLTFAPEKLHFKLSRVSVLANAKNKFGRSGLFEFGKSFFKLLIYSVVLTYFLLNRLPEILGALHAEAQVAAAVLVRLTMEFLLFVLAIAIVIGAVDYLWQYQEHIRKNRMSRKDLTDETKQSEGDPHVKQQRRQKGYAIAMNQMLSSVPEADVVIVNPEHYAVALKWNRQPGAAPLCVAKGTDEIAARIREIAIESGIPIHRDPPTARALFAVVEIGQEIWPEHYPAVAAAIRFAETIRTRAGRSM